MNVLIKWLLRVLAGVLGLLAIASGARLVPRRPLAAGLSRASSTVAGLDQPVQIIRDANAVPHIRAATDHDAYYALGLVHAQDRLWQMELNRRSAQGRLSALLGARTVEVDRLVKTLDLYGLAARSLEAQSPETRAALDAYAEGVNAWIRHVNARGAGAGGARVLRLRRRALALDAGGFAGDPQDDGAAPDGCGARRGAARPGAAGAAARTGRATSFRSTRCRRWSRRHGPMRPGRRTRHGADPRHATRWRR